MDSIKKWYNKIINFGITPSIDVLEQKRILLLNELVVWAFLFQCSNYFILVYIGQYEAIISVIISQIFILIPLTFNYFHKTNLSKWLAILASVLFIALIMISFGRDFRVDYAFLFMSVLVVVLFPKVQQRFILSFYIIGIYLLAEWYLSYFSPLTVNDQTDVGSGFMFVLMTVLMGILLGRFVRINLNIEEELTQLSAEIIEKNELLLLDQIQIDSQNQSLERANKELETFAYVASHDLKSPLRNITSFLNLIQRKLKNHDDTAVHEYLDFATRSAKQMHYLIQDILEFSKLGNSEIELKEVNLNEVVKNVLVNITNSIQERHALIEMTQLPTLSANETQMTLLFQNLIENGIKYNVSEQPKVEITYTEEDEHHLISIQDNGIGIPEADQEKIFEMFQRLKDKSDEDGSGIGLAICKKIVMQHNGSIRIESQLEKGTSFFIRFPT